MPNEKVTDLDSLHDDEVSSSEETTDINGKKPGEDGYIPPTDNNELVDKNGKKPGEEGYIEPEKEILDKNGKKPGEDGYIPPSQEEELLTGTEKFLTQYGIEAGIIEFEDGTKKHFDELEKDEQFNVLKSLVEKNKAEIEKEYDLDEEEIGFLNFARENKMTVTEAINALVEEAIVKRGGESDSIDYNTLSNDEIYMKYLKELNPDAKKEDLQTELEEAKKLKSFEKSVNNLKETYIKNQNDAIENEKQKIAKEEAKNLEAEREEIVNTVSSIKHVAGWEISDEQKNECLSELVEVNEFGDSKFMERVFSSPELLFKVAWLEKYGEKYFDEMSEYYKNQISEARKRGREEAINGLEKNPIVTGGKNGKVDEGNGKKVQKRDELTAKTLDELHDEDDAS